jgi:hypothetical protein
MPQASLRKKRSSHSTQKRRALVLEWLEPRALLALEPLSLADAGLFGLSGYKDSGRASISADGQLVAFISDADNLVPNDTNGLPDVFVYEPASNTVTLVSVSATGQAQGVNPGQAPTISPDGRFVAYQRSTNELPQPFPNANQAQLVVRDLAMERTLLVTTATDGVSGGNGYSFGPVFSADSHHLVFVSSAQNLVDGITFTGTANVFEYNLVTGTTLLVSRDLAGTGDGNNATLSTAGLPAVSVSADGRYVAFHSYASNLAANDGNGIDDVFVRDTVANTTSLISADSTGLVSANQHSVVAPGGQFISADGRYVVFASAATNLTSTPVGGVANRAYLRDTLTGTTVGISIGADGTIRNGNDPVISPDGKYVAFQSSEGLIASDTNGLVDIYLYSVGTGGLSLVSVNAVGANGGNANSGRNNDVGTNAGLVFSGDGRYLAFQSYATDLTPGANGPPGASGNLYLLEIGGGTRLLSRTPSGALGNGDSSYSVALSFTGQVAAFASGASELVPGDANRKVDVFVRDQSLGATSLASQRSPALPAAVAAAAGAAALTSVSQSGRYVGFESNVFYGNSYSDLAPGVTFSSGFSQSHAFVRDRQTGSAIPVDVNASGVAVGGASPVLTPDGHYVAFVGYPNLLPGGITVTTTDDRIAYVRDMQAGTSVAVSLTPDGAHDIPLSDNPEVTITPDGRFVAFLSTSAEFPGVTNPSGKTAVYLRDLQLNTTTLVSDNDTTISGNARDISISDDGRYVLFRSDDSTLAPLDNNDSWDVFRWDRTTGQIDLVSANVTGLATGNAPSANGDPPVMSADGRYIAFSSMASDFVLGDTNNRYDVFLRDMQLGTTTLVSADAAGGNSNDHSGWAAISADGKRIAFLSSATDLTTGINYPRAQTQVFVRDLTTNITMLASVNAAGDASGNDVAGGPGPNNSAINPPVLSADGRWVAFWSYATDLVSGFMDANGNGYLSGGDLYVRDLQIGATKLASVNQSGTAGANYGLDTSTVLFAGDGSSLVFTSTASDLFPGDRNWTTDVLAAPTAGFGSISGMVFEDSNRNGLNDGEPGLPDWSVYIDANSNGVWDQGEPVGVTDASGGYRLGDLLPGAYVVAVKPQAGYQQTQPMAPFTRLVSITADGESVIGASFGEVLPRADLAMESVVAHVPATSPGKSLDVSWTVTNQGNLAATGAWSDAIYLSPVPMLGPDAQLLATVAHVGELAAGAHYDGSTSVVVPPLLGDWFVIVQSDRRHQVSEGPFGTHRANNTAPSATTISVSVPALVIGTPALDQLSPTTPDRYFQVTAASGNSLILSLASAASSGQIELFVKRNRLPTDFDFDFAAKNGLPVQSLTIPTPEADTYFILVRGAGGDVLSDTFTLTASEPGLSIQSLDVTTGGNQGRVTIPIRGSDFTPATQVNLILGETSLAPIGLQFHDASLIYATFDLTGQATGDYDVSVSDGGTPFVKSAAFTVAPAASAGLELFLNVPAVSRYGRETKFRIELLNRSNSDLPMPTLLLTADLATLRLPEQPTFAGGALQFTPSSPDGPANILRPGQRVQMIVIFLSTGPVGETIHFLVAPAPPEGEGEGSPLPPPGPPGASGRTVPRGALDPNEIVGPAGFGSQNFLRPEQTLPFTIYFENDPVRATLAAQEVVIDQQLDDDLDWSTFAFGEISFGTATIVPPADAQSFTASVYGTNVDGTPVLVDIDARLDRATGVATWSFRSLDPLTGELPENPFAGFLPVNDATGRGEGFVHYTVRPRFSLATGAELTAAASIVFDTNAPLVTNTASNLIDSGSPSSQVSSLATTQNTAAFAVSWTGTDDGNGSGIAHYDVYVSDNGNPYTLFLSQTLLTTASFVGEPGHSYAFLTIATDNVGHREPAPEVADAATTLVTNLWHNFGLPEDVDGVLGVQVQDAIAIIRDLRRSGSRDVAGAPDPVLYLDVTNNGRVDVQDALAVIRYLRRNRPAGEGEGEGHAKPLRIPDTQSQLSPSLLEAAIDAISSEIAAKKRLQLALYD